MEEFLNSLANQESDRLDAPDLAELPPDLDAEPIWHIAPADPELLAAVTQSLASGPPGSPNRAGTAVGAARPHTRSRSPLRASRSAFSGSPETSPSPKGGSSGVSPQSTWSHSDLLKGSKRSAAGPMASTTASGLRVPKDEGPFEIQQRTKDYMARTLVLKDEIAGVQGHIDEVKAEIDRYSKGLGGVFAVRTNDYNVALQTDIMERRIVKAQTEYMDNIARNDKLRADINLWRREIGFLLKANGSIQADIKRLEQQNQELEKSIVMKTNLTQETEGEIERTALQKELDEDVLRAQWERAEAGDIHLDLPAPDAPVAPSGQLSREQEVKMKSGTVESRWLVGTQASFLMQSEHSLQSLKDIFSVISQMTGIATPEEFADQFAAAEAKNYALYCRVDKLNQEAADIKQELEVVRQQLSTFGDTTVDEERKTALGHVTRALDQARDRLTRQKESYQSMVLSADVVRVGLHRIMDLLGTPEEDLLILEEGSLGQFYGAFEQRMRETLQKYISVVMRPELEAATEKRSFRMDKKTSKRMGLVGSLLGINEPVVSVDDLDRAAKNRNVAPLLPPSAIAIGPGVRSGDLNKALQGVNVPSVEGPKDSRQLAAFVKPWQATAEQGSEDEGPVAPVSVQEVEDMFGDRPVSVPVGYSRNTRSESVQSEPAGDSARRPLTGTSEAVSDRRSKASSKRDSAKAGKKGLKRTGTNVATAPTLPRL